MDADWKRLLIHDNVNIKQALKKMDAGGEKILFIINKDSILLGVVSDGDIRRYILSDGKLEDPVSGIYNRNPLYARKDYGKKETKKIMVDNKIEVLPIIDEKNKVVGAINWTDLFGNQGASVNEKISVPVVIMAGGKGKRMDPFTKILPKPLIPIGEKPIIEIIMDKFSRYGVNHFYITLNFKGKMVKIYFDSVAHRHRIDYIWEKEFLGTAGSLKLLPTSLSGDFIVSNCDIIVEADYADLLRFHRENKNILTAVGSIQHHIIPYGIIHFEKKGKIKKIQEKPELDFTINTGVYVLSKKAVDFIPKNKYFDMTNLIQTLLDKRQKMGVYPISQRAYIDIGQWEEYKRYLQDFIV